jgi:pyroglutamyl-peptidase
MKSAPVLVTGFEPFGGDGINPSAEIVRALNGHVIAGRNVVGAVLPCVFRESARELARLVRRHQPVAVIATGLAGGRAEVTPERVAINVDDARIADNAGGEPIDRPIARGGPAAYWSRLPIKAIVAALRQRGIPAAVSQTAGTFVCNHVFYSLMHGLRNQPRMRAGFIHVPYLPELARNGQPCLPQQKLNEAIAVAIEVTLAARKDRREPGGQTH